MKIVVVYSSKAGLFKEYKKRRQGRVSKSEVPADFFAEGDSPETINAVMESLRNQGHDIIGIEGDDTAARKLEKNQPQLVFNITEGLWGDCRESYIPMICERLGLAYTGSEPLTLAICLNKARTKEILSFHYIANAPFQVYYPGQKISLNGFTFPGIIKPVAEGSSKGIFNDSVVDDAETAKQRIIEKLQHYNQPVLMEKFLTGQEFTLAIWGNGENVEVLPIVAIDYAQLPPNARPIYSYEAKWIWDTPAQPLEIFHCPAPIPVGLRKRIEDVAVRAYRMLQIRDWCRIDIRLDENQTPNILELNPLPGILPNPEDNSCFPKAARTAGYNYSEMLNKVVTIAAKRCGIVDDNN